jgi:MFS family permease
LATLQAPILEEMNAMSYFSLLTIFSSLGLSIMTPIGGKLGDLLGRRNIVIISGTICAICGIGMGFVRSLVPFMILRLLLGAAQGAFTAAPFILAREINEPKDVPKAMGLLSSAVAVGGFGGSIIAGILTDMGLLNVAIMFPAIPLLIGVILIGLNLPNKKREGNVNIDIPGIIALAITLTGILLALNYGPKIGWTQPGILAGFAVGIIALFVLVKVENKAAEPIIPMSLFKNKNYVTLLAVGFICYFYMTAMNTYAPLAVQKVLGQSTAVSGSLQMPRTIITILLPMAAGAWVGKKAQNSWKAMSIATTIVGVAFLVLGLTTTTTTPAANETPEEDLPQTGFSKLYNCIPVSAGALVLLGMYAVKKSKKEDEE